MWALDLLKIQKIAKDLLIFWNICFSWVNLLYYTELLNHFQNNKNLSNLKGTEKYPEVNYYKEFITNNGGSSNAYTDLTNTVFHFNIGNAGFNEAVDIFSQFFHSPLLNKDSVDKEINAVNSEFYKNLNNDARRVMQIFRANSNPDSSFSMFSTGNLKTLKQPNIYDRLREFYKEYYR